jgi:hypothetical protein
MGAAFLNFDKDNCITITKNEINFATASAPAFCRQT